MWSLVFSLVACVSSFPTSEKLIALDVPAVNISKAMFYLSKYGYMDADVTNSQSGALLSADVMKKSIMEFQQFANITVTGELDEETLRMMSMPRCGVKDIVGHSNSARKKRYALQGSRWRTKELTYRISKYPATSHGISEQEVDNTIKQALDVWSTVTDLKFTAQSRGNVHIEIRFEKGEHGDGDPFDGIGGTLAHAYFPIYGGDAHFDDSERWTIKSFRGTNLFQVAAHEFGHSLGLSHSDVSASLMAPYYRGYDRDFSLHSDDVDGIQALYGSKTSTVTTTTTKKPGKPTTTEKPRTDQDLCMEPSFDAIITAPNQKTYVFKGDKYWRLNDDGIDPGYPKSIEKLWEIPGNLDAAFTYRDGRTFFFKGSQYWRFTNLEKDSGYPKPISAGFKGIPSNIDAAFVWGGNGKIYFFKGSKYYRFDPAKKPPVRNGYPKAITNWEGLPTGDFDGATQYTNGYTYFFKKGQYWRFNDNRFTVDSSYPRDVGQWWFGCTAGSLQNDRGDQDPKDEDNDIEGEGLLDAGNIDETVVYTLGDSVHIHINGNRNTTTTTTVDKLGFSLLDLLLRTIV